jgi:hypothetical protein
VKFLLKKPGFLSKEYMIGRRASYLNPIRMYVFTSAIFFIVIFSLQSSRNIVKIDEKPQVQVQTSPKSRVHVGDGLFGWDSEQYATVQAYDSTQRVIPEGQRDGWFKRHMMTRLINTDVEFKKDSHAYSEHLVENFLHSFPKILFISLPFFALILRLLYVRRKQYLYVDHGIFTLHVYCATFILLMAMILLNELSNGVGWHWLQKLIGFLMFAIFVYILVYLFMAMRGFYGQGRGKSFLKYIVLCLLALVLNLGLLLLGLLISAITV